MVNMEFVFCAHLPGLKDAYRIGKWFLPGESVSVILPLCENGCGERVVSQVLVTICAPLISVDEP